MKPVTRAILREPGKSFVNALSIDLNANKPDYEKTKSEYQDYAKTLEKMGIKQLTICPADENFPDGNFVEDTYFILDNKLMIELNPGAASRKNEYVSLKPYLPNDLPLHVLSKEYSIDGGDILKDGETIYIGLSKRTQQEAIDEFTKIVKPYGYEVRSIPVCEGLHLKSNMSMVTAKNYVIHQSLVTHLQRMQENDADIQFFVVPEEENHAANVLTANGHIMIPDDSPQTKNYIARFYPPERIHEVSTKQIRLVDGGLTCSSLLLE